MKYGDWEPVKRREKTYHAELPRLGFIPAPVGKTKEPLSVGW